MKARRRRLRLRSACACAYALGAVALCAVRPAWAGCPNGCEIEMDPPIVQPPQGGCAIVNATRKTCDCGVELNIGNACQVDLVASGFTFSTCETDGGVEKNCNTVRRGELGRVVEKLDEVGPVEWTFNLEGERGAESITVRANVREFADSGCACALPRAGDAAPGTAALFLGSGLFAGLSVRRSRRRLRP